MGWIRRLLGFSSKEELEGIKLDWRVPCWEVTGPKTFVELFAALDGWLPEDAVLYFEGGSFDKEIVRFVAEYAIPEQTHVAFGTVWPRPQAFHIPAGHQTLAALSALAEHHEEADLAIHFHVYREGQVMLEWHDAFDETIWLRGDLPEGEISRFADRLGTSYERTKASDEQRAKEQPDATTNTSD